MGAVSSPSPVMFSSPSLPPGAAWKILDGGDYSTSCDITLIVKRGGTDKMSAVSLRAVACCGWYQ